MKYALSIQVGLREIPEAPELPELRPGDDPIKHVGSIMTGIMAPVMARPGFIADFPAGFEFRKQIEIRAQSFQNLAEIIGKFDSLVSDIEAERLECK